MVNHNIGKVKVTLFENKHKPGSFLYMNTCITDITCITQPHKHFDVSKAIFPHYSSFYQEVFYFVCSPNTTFQKLKEFPFAVVGFVKT